MKRLALYGIIIGALFAACHPEPNASPDYADVPQLYVGEYKEHPHHKCDRNGDRRFSLGVMYDGCEGQDERTLLLNADESAFYPYITDDGMIDTNNYDQTCHFRNTSEGLAALPDSRVEGVYGSQIVHNGITWWGVAVHLLELRTIDMTKYKHLYLSIRTNATIFSDFKIYMVSGHDSREFDPDNPNFDDDEPIVRSFVRVGNADYDYSPGTGFTNDGEWHHLRIPLKDFSGATGLDKSRVSRPIQIIGDLSTGGSPDRGEVLDIDGVFFM